MSGQVVPLFAPRLDGKPPPHDDSAEAATLTACMLAPERAIEALAIAGHEDYFGGAHQAIAKSIAELLDAGTSPDMTAVSMRLRETGRALQVGGAPALIEMANSVPAITNLVKYATVVHELATLRRLIACLQRLTAEAYEPIADTRAFLARVDAEIGAITRTAGEHTAASALEATQAVARELSEGAKPTVTTGFRQLDRLTTGLEDGAMYVLAARPGMGKTALAVQMAIAAAKADCKTLYVSLEMGKTELMRRMICLESRVPLQAVRERQISQSQWTDFVRLTSEIARLPLVISDRPGQTLLDIKSEVRRHAPRLVIVDHVGLIRVTPGAASARRSREQEVAEFSRGLKVLAKELSLPVLVLCQVGRDVARGARRPGMSDLRESGSLEQDADAVLLIHRPGYYDPRPSPEVAKQAELIVAKQRNGATAIVPLEWDAPCARFTEVRDWT